MAWKIVSDTHGFFDLVEGGCGTVRKVAGRVEVAEQARGRSRPDQDIRLLGPLRRQDSAPEFLVRGLSRDRRNGSEQE